MSDTSAVHHGNKFCICNVNSTDAAYWEDFVRESLVYRSYATPTYDRHPIITLVGMSLVAVQSDEVANFAAAVTRNPRLLLCTGIRYRSIRRGC